MKYTFSCDADSVKVIHEISDDNLHIIIEQFEYFLKACGFQFQGQLDFVDSDRSIYDFHEFYKKDWGWDSNMSSSYTTTPEVTSVSLTEPESEIGWYNSPDKEGKVGTIRI